MPAYLQISLSESENQELSELSHNPKVPKRTRQRAEVLQLNARGWKEEDIKYLEDCCDHHQRTYNSKQLSVLLKKERQVELSAERIRKILKKRAENGSEQKRVRDLIQTQR